MPMTARAKTLLVLGAGIHQIPGIRAALARGLRVVTCDWDLNNPGHALATACAEASTTDRTAALAVARAHAIDGVTTFASDPAAATVAYIARELGLPGPAVETVEVMSHKGRIRALQHARGLPSPAFEVAERGDVAVTAAARLGGRVMIKPVDSSGSRGVREVAGDDAPAVAAAFEAAVAFSRARAVCVEEVVRGEEVGGDGLLVDGKIVFARCTRKYKRGFVVEGHALPARISMDDQARVIAEVAAVCRAAGYRDGVVNFDVMVDAGRACVLELSPRTGGNGIPALIAATTGMNLLDAAIASALGEPPPSASPAAIASQAAGSLVIGADRPGRIVRMRSEEEVRAAVPELLEYSTSYRTGMLAPRFEHGGAALGYAVFACPPGAGHDEMASRVREAIGLVVEEAR